MSIKIRDKKIGCHSPCYITFEAGPTINGLDSALALVEQAAAAGADAIKFQIFKPDQLIADKSLLFSYEVLVDRETGETKKVEEPLYDIFVRRYLERDQWKEVKRLTDKLNLGFFATVGFQEDIDFLVELGADSIKVASMDVNHLPFLKQAAETGMVIQLDTGNASLGEIENAVDEITATGNENIIIHQCPSGYPARLESINLKMIQTLHKMFPYPIAFSDHTPGWDMDVAAVTMGANLLEKTITLDRTTPSVEHIMSIEGKELPQFVKTIRDVETAFGTGRRIISEEQKQHRDQYRRSAFLKRAMTKGEVITAQDIEYQRPGTGISPSDYKNIEGKKLNKPLEKGYMLRWTDLEA